jgi:3-oxoacyl-[acyl-carrier protein] reductase
MSRLEGKVAVVTGAGRGIGRAIALKLASEGARVVINDLDAEPAQETLDALLKVGPECRAVIGDVTVADFPARIIAEATEGLGRLDIIVNNAGYIWNTSIQNTSDEQWQAMLDVHAGAPFRLLRAAADYLRETARAEVESRGAAHARKVVNVSSIVGTRGAATMVAYSAGKAALLGLTKTLAQEWGRFNITVNCVAFGFIETRLTQSNEGGSGSIEVLGRRLKVGFIPEQRARQIAQIPLLRAGTPEEAAGAVYLFCIPESDYITGQVLECAGGL